MKATISRPTTSQPMRGIQGDPWIAFMRTAVSVAQLAIDFLRPFELENTLDDGLYGSTAGRLYGVYLPATLSLGGWAARKAEEGLWG